MKYGTLPYAAALALFAARAAAQNLPDDAPLEPAPEPPAVAPAAPVKPPEPPAPPPTPVEVVLPAPEPLPPPPAPPDVKEVEPPKHLAVGKEGFWRPGIVAQAWVLGTHSDDEWKQTTFRLRRLELKWTGDVVRRRVGYTVVIDPARLLESTTVSVPVTDAAGETIGTASVSQPASASSIVQDAVVTVMSDYVDVSIGQFKIPVSYEAYGSVAQLLFPERSTVSRRLGERRDMGLRAEKKFEYFGYVGAVLNGEGQNRLDSNDQKDVALRLELYPTQGLTLAGVGYTSVGERELTGTKDRMEGDVRLDVAGLLLQGEYIRARDRVTPTLRVVSQGFYGVLGYTFAKVLQPLVRFGYFDPNVKQSVEAPADFARLDEQKEYSAGITYYLLAHEAKLQLATSVFDYHQAPTEVTTIFCAQASF